MPLHVSPQSLDPGRKYAAVEAEGCKHCKAADPVNNPTGKTVVEGATVRHFGKDKRCTVLSGKCRNTGNPTKIFLSKKSTAKNT